MEYECSKCQSTKYKEEEIIIQDTGEVVTVYKCNNCGTTINAEIKRPYGKVLRKKHGARELRFSENEKRNFTSWALSMLDMQIRLLAAIAEKSGVDNEDIEKIINDDKNIYYFNYILRKDDESIPPDVDI